jgi:hypothetical protein
MTASGNTVKQVADIMVDELGVFRAANLVNRIHDFTTGNSSYTATIKALRLELNQRSSVERRRSKRAVTA